MKYLLATTNKAKIKRYAPKLIENGIDIVTLNDLNLELDIDENGNNPTENAIIKATAYNKATNMPAIAIDDGLFLDNVPNEIQPGTHVRRVNGKRLNDQEMIEHYISLVNKYGNNCFMNSSLQNILHCENFIDRIHSISDKNLFNKPLTREIKILISCTSNEMNVAYEYFNS